MKLQMLAAVAVAGAFVVAGSALAGSIQVDLQGGALMMQSGSLSDLFTDTSTNRFRGAALESVHNSLQADGVTTDGMVTFVLADTGNGLSFMALMDDETVGGGAPGETMIGMSTTAPSTTNYFINDPNDPVSINDPFGINTTAAGEFGWNDNRGDGFAWTQLSDGDGVTFNFTDLAGTGLGVGDFAFQFVTFNGESWEVVEMGNWTDDGQFAFSFMVTMIPLPTPVLMGVAGLAGVALLRRRRG